MNRKSKTYAKPTGKLANMKVKPAKGTGGSDQPKGMKSASQLRREAIMEDKGKK